MEKRFAVAAVIYNPKGEVLFAKRAQTKQSFPGALSLPSTYVRGDYSEEQLMEAVKRKLNLDIKIKERAGSTEGVQYNYFLHMADYFAEIQGGEIKPNAKDYSEAFFANPKEVLNQGELGFCTKILLNL